jgi:hypothetical protein
MAWAFPVPAVAAEPAGAAPGDAGSVPLEFGPAACDCEVEIVAAAGVAPPPAEPPPVPAVVVAAAVVAAAEAAEDAATAAAAAVGAGGGEELPDTGNSLPTDPPSDALLAAALRTGLEASFIADAKSLPLVLCAEELA